MGDGSALCRQAMAVPSFGVPPSRPGAAEVFSRGSRVAIVQPGGHPVRDVAGVEVDRGQHRARHDRALRHPGALQRAAPRQVGVAAATRSQFGGCSSRSTRAHPSAAIRFDIDAMWMSATSSAIPRIRTSGGSADHASTIRPNSALVGHRRPESSRCTAGRDDLDDVVERRPLGALVRRRDGRHRVGVHERVGPVQGVEGPRPARSKASPCADPGPAHDARPIRCPSRRVRSNRSTVPSGPELATRLLQRPGEVDQVGRDVVAAEQRLRQRSPAVEDLVGKLAPQHQDSRRDPCSRLLRAARRTTRRRSVRT